MSDETKVASEAEVVEAMARAVYAKRDTLDSDSWDMAVARKAMLARLPGGTHCDPQDIADIIRALPTPPAAMEGGKDE